MKTPATRLFIILLLPAFGCAATSTPTPKNESTAMSPRDPLEAPDNVAAPPAEATTTASGLAYLRIKEGTGGAHPSATSRVEVHYTGWTTDGKMFDSSVARGQTITFPLNGVIKGWTEGVQLMQLGDKFRFWIPADLAYGENPGGGRPGGMLVFDVELFSIY